MADIIDSGIANTAGAANTAAAAAAAKKLSDTPSQSQVARTSIAKDLDQFLLLLTTQLKNQDPTEPLDTNQMTAQLVGFAGVEQQVATNKNLESLISMTQASRVQTGISYIGKAVDAEGNSGFLANKASAFVYELPAGVESAAVTILNESGQAVFSGNGSKAKGKNIVSWDGTSNIGAAAGTAMKDGRYSISVVAKGADGKEIKTGVKTYTTGYVSAANYDEEGNLNLEVGTLDIPIDKVFAVREAA